MDPRTLYNADLLKNLVTSDSQANQFHLINTRLYPNWFAHLLLAGMLFFFSGEVEGHMLPNRCLTGRRFRSGMNYTPLIVL